MPQNPPAGTPRVAPYLLYEDVAGALDFLARAFGFEERRRVEDEDGTVTHAEMRLADGEIMLGHPGADYRNPARLGGYTCLVHVYVDRVDEHCARARDAGAVIHTEPADQPYGDRRYDAEDPEGHRWSFAEHVRDVPAEEWGAAEGGR